MPSRHRSSILVVVDWLDPSLFTSLPQPKLGSFPAERSVGLAAYDNLTAQARTRAGPAV